MKYKLLFGTFAVLVIGGLLCAAAAVAQEPLDATQAGQYHYYPDYLATSCGGVQHAQTESGLVAMVQVTTTCSSGGRGSKPRHYLSCTRVTFASDRFYILDREQVLYAMWVQGQPGYSCPVL